jgi:hypothetical protein
VESERVPGACDDHIVIPSRAREFRQQQPRAEIVEVSNASHFLFLGATQQDTVRRTRDFLSR